MDFNAFDTKKIDEYAQRAKAQWGNTKEYTEYAAKSSGRSKEAERDTAEKLMSVFAEFGKLRGKAADSAEVTEQVKKLQSCITENYYNCSDEILAALGQMYTANDEFRQNIDKAGGEGTAAFVSAAIAEYTRK